MRRRGFTLIELIVTLSMIGMIMAAVYGTLFGTIRAKERTQFAVMASRYGPRLLDQIEQDLRQLFTYNLAGGAVLRGENQRVNGVDADKILLVSHAPSLSGVVERDKTVFSAVNEVGYALTVNPENPDFLVLWRREDFFVDEEPLKGGKGTALYHRVTGFDVTWYDRLGEDAEDFDSWDTEERHGLPAAVEIVLRLEVQPRDLGTALTMEELQRRTYTFRRWITFPDDLTQAIGVRPLLPVAGGTTETPGEGEDDEGAGGLGGKGGKGKGKGGDASSLFGGG